MKKPKTPDEYIASAPKESRAKLREMRGILKKAAPKATEEIRWRLPAFVDGRILFMYAAFKSHLGLYPTPSAMKPFAKDLEKFTTGKGSIQFPYDKPLPKSLITRIAKQRVKDLKEKDVRWM
jgi:uncharacterized protein YdhG (YjbR/CyaY superfamily)